MATGTIKHKYKIIAKYKGKLSKFEYHFVPQKSYFT